MVAIVIAGRNSTPYLRETIESALAQSIRCEVVYADDCSIDDSVAIAMSYLDQGLSVLPGGAHKGVCDARNRGAAATRAPYLIHLDSDDILPRTFVADHLEAIAPGVPFVYGPAQAFGDQASLWGVPAWETYDRWWCNTVNTCAMYARWAFDLAGGWDPSVPTMWDFDLMLRAARYGTPRASKATMLYRIHGQSFSASLNERDHLAAIPWREMIRRRNARLGLSALISGRLPGLFPAWLDRIAASVRFAQLPHAPRLQLWLHDGAQPDQAALARYGDTFASIDLQRIEYAIPSSPEADRRDGVATLLAMYSAAAQAAANSDLLWLIEDDILVSRTACRALLAAATAGETPPIGVSGLYRNRHIREKFVGGWLRNGQHEEPTEFTEEIQGVDFVGTGCLMFWTSRPGSPKEWRSHVDGTPAHDWAWSEQAGPLVMHGGVRCEHAIADGEVLKC